MGMLQGERRLPNEFAGVRDRQRPTAPLEGGKVRQHFEQYDAQAERWSDWFIGIYHPETD